MGQIMEGLTLIAWLRNLNCPLKVWDNRLMWHYQKYAFIRFIKHHYVERSRICENSRNSEQCNEFTYFCYEGQKRVM